MVCEFKIVKEIASPTTYAWPERRRREGWQKKANAWRSSPFRNIVLFYFFVVFFSFVLSFSFLFIQIFPNCSRCYISIFDGLVYSIDILFNTTTSFNHHLSCWGNMWANFLHCVYWVRHPGSGLCIVRVRVAKTIENAKQIHKYIFFFYAVHYQ